MTAAKNQASPLSTFRVILARPGARPRSTWRSTKLAQTQMMGQRDRKEQASIGHQAVIVEGDLDAVRLLRWWHLMGAPVFGSVLCFQNHYPRSREHFLIHSAHRHIHLFGGLGVSGLGEVLVGIVSEWTAFRIGVPRWKKTGNRRESSTA